MDLETLRELYVAKLNDLYSVEKQLVQALPKMAKHATTPELKQAFESHFEETQKHVERLDHIFDTLDATPSGRHCRQMEALLEDAGELADEGAAADVLDAGLISRAQYVEHYEIAAYGTVRRYAMILGEADHLRLLQQTLHEEAVVDEWLTDIAQASLRGEVAMSGQAADAAQVNRDVRDREVTRPAVFDRLTLREESRGIRHGPRDSTREAHDR
jgi:ferritin-like metal-binding protein YciE